MLADGGMTHDQMHGLMDLLNVSREQENSQPAVQAEPAMKVAVKKKVKKDEKAIWQPEEFKAASGVVVKDEADDRQTPKHEILHRQKVGAQDAYLNLMEMDPSSDQCQEITVKIWLPDTQLKDISVDVLEDRLLLQAPKYKLNLPLPYRVTKDSGNAKWDKLKGLLSVVIPISTKVKYYTNAEEAFLKG
eukprot:gnl/TRDRNA2_/TRDRNA2_37945_c0_seq1.p1 gnl/TRDRNA2_/TRDRNA2_37945_c0~~gnl/TRDRNA2_/TRDRNA2_37945_c0_seq1.p1  ORF type:complete len:189 (+),score=47.87 gnl/TRDRNA2_/TRDRNA2_37945_c0_seq1:131-697(+)